MVQLNNRYSKFLLLLYWCIFFLTPAWGTEHGSMGVYSWQESGGIREEVANIMLGLLFLGLVKLGDYLDDNPMAGYSCPDYCEVDHEHYKGKDYEEKDEEATDKQRDTELYGPTLSADRE